MIVGQSPDPVIRVTARIDEHVAAELTSDPTRIMTTISADPFFPVLVRDEHQSAALTMLTDTESVAGFYQTRVGIFEIVDSMRVAEVRSDWYALHESVATVRHVGDYLGLAPTGETHDVHSVVLFPVDHDGIVGELEWTRVDFSRIFRGLPVDHATATDGDGVAPVARQEAAHLHDRVIEAWFTGEVEELAMLVGDAPWAGRHVHADSLLPPLIQRSAGADLTDVTSAFGVIDLANDSRRLQRYATPWFSFLELAIDVVDDGRDHSIRLISLLALEQGRVAGHLVYSVDVVATSDDQPTSHQSRRDHGNH